MREINSLQTQRGYLTLIVVVLIVIVGFIAVSLAYMTFGSGFATINLQKSTSALYMAESGLEDATHKLATPLLASRASCTGLSLTDTLGNGTYTVASSGPFYVSSPTTLNGALTAGSTSITVTSTANYQSAGRIMIDREFIDYTSVDATHFLNLQRGADGTTAAAHATGTAVGQYQCHLSSTGGDPKTTYTSGEPGGKRILSQDIQLEEAWVVADNNGSNLNIYRWNRPTEHSWNSAVITGSADLNGVSMSSYVDGWAVGQNSAFIRWNGNAWSSFSSGLASVVYNGVYCVSRNNCHAVGNMGSNNNIPTLTDWNGTVWTASTLNIGSRSGNQFGVHCAAANDCWSVGNIGQNANNSFFYRWNGSTWAQSQLSGYASGDFPYRGVFCTSTSNCWAVGASANFARWNGTSWARIASGMPSVQYNGIYCNEASDCWAVGNTSSGSVVIIRWNGTAWSRDTSNPTPAVNLNAVACSGRNNCWAVGNSTGGQPAFYHWDGSTWTKISTTGFNNVNANSISMLGPNTHPASAWDENFS